MKTLLIILMVLIWCPPCSATMCKVVVQDSDGLLSVGSGSLSNLITPSGNQVVITAAHVLNARRSNVAVVEFKDISVYGKIFHTNSDADIAFIAVIPKYVSHIPATVLSGTTPVVGSAVVVRGISSGVSHGYVTKLDEYTQLGNPILTTNVRVIEGDSGGPVLDQWKRQVSVVSSRGDGSQVGLRTDVMSKAVKYCNLQGMYCDESGRCFPQQQVRPAQRQIQSPLPPQTSEPVTVQPQIPIRPAPQQPVIQKHQLEIVIKQPQPQELPPAQWTPVKPEIDYASISSAIESAVPKTVQLEFEADAIVKAVSDAIKESQVVPDAIRFEIYDRKTNQVYHDQTYQLRGVTGVLNIRIPYDRSGIGDKGSFRLNVQ